MSIRVMSEVWRTKLPLSEKMILLVIADHASDEGDNAWPSQKTIAERASCTIRTVQRCVNNLVADGYLRMEKHAGGSLNCRDDRRPHRYTINLKKVRESNNASRGDNMSWRNDVANEATITTTTRRQSRLKNHPIDTPIELSLFDQFWKAYPRKTAKKAALKAWLTAIKDAPSPQFIIEKATAYAKDPTREDKFTAYPATWLNQGRYMDEFSKSRTTPEIAPYDPLEAVQRRQNAVPMPESIKALFKSL